MDFSVLSILENFYVGKIYDIHYLKELLQAALETFQVLGFVIKFVNKYLLDLTRNQIYRLFTN